MKAPLTLLCDICHGEIIEVPDTINIVKKLINNSGAKHKEKS
jgi:hypothetical protein